MNCCQKHNAVLASRTLGLLPGSQKISTSTESQEHLRTEKVFILEPAEYTPLLSKHPVIVNFRDRVSNGPI